MEQQIKMVENWNQGLQRQIAGLMVYLKIPADKFCQNTRQLDEINKFLVEAQDIENQMIKAEQAKKDEQLSKIDEFKPQTDEKA